MFNFEEDKITIGNMNNEEDMTSFIWERICAANNRFIVNPDIRVLIGKVDQTQSGQVIISPVYHLKNLDIKHKLVNPYNRLNYLKIWIQQGKDQLEMGSYIALTVKKGRMKFASELLTMKKHTDLGKLFPKDEKEVINSIVDNNLCPEINDELLRDVYPSEWQEYLDRQKTVNSLKTDIEQLKDEKAKVQMDKDTLEKEKQRVENSKQESENKLKKTNEQIQDVINESRRLKFELDIKKKERCFFMPETRNSDKEIEYNQKINQLYFFKSRLDYDYSDEQIMTFLMALNTLQLIILYGKPGIGKTTFVRKAAKALGAKLTIIRVQNNWTDSSDLLGYYSPIQNTYESTEFVDALIAANADWLKYERKSPFHIICLDEMNLARIEYYFAEFLSLLQLSLDDRVIHLLPRHIQEDIQYHFGIDFKDEEKVQAKRKELLQSKDKEEKALFFLGRYLDFQLPPNVRFVGTINMDETTNEISPKVRDRSIFLTISSENYEDDKEKEINDYYPISYFENGKKDMDDEIKSQLEEFCKGENKRFRNYIHSMWAMYCNCKPDDWNDASFKMFRDLIANSKDMHGSTIDLTGEIPINMEPTADFVEVDEDDLPF